MMVLNRGPLAELEATCLVSFLDFFDAALVAFFGEAASALALFSGCCFFSAFLGAAGD